MVSSDSGDLSLCGQGLALSHAPQAPEGRGRSLGWISGAREAAQGELGALLLQFPSNFRASEANLERIDRFLGHATRRGSRRLALEFRDPSCFEDEMLAILKRHRAALVISHSSRYPVPEPCATADFSYFRFHGPKKWCASAYSHDELRGWAGRITAMLAGRRDVYAFFNNDAGGHAPRDACSLLKILQERNARTSPTFSASISRSHQ